MAVTPTGLKGKLLDNLRTLVAASSTFQTWVGAEDAAAAKAHIYLVGVDPAGEGESLASKRPMAVVRHKVPADVEAEAVAGGARQHFTHRGALELLFEDTVATAQQSDHGDAELAFANHVDGVLSDMKALAGSGTYLNMIGHATLNGPARAHPDERASEGDYYQQSVEIEWSDL